MRDLEVSPGTSHCHLSDVEEPDSVPPQLNWRYCGELCPERLLELIFSYMEKGQPQRLSISAFQLFVGLHPEREIIKVIDEALEAAKGTAHIISICTLRYLPSSFVTWDTVNNINRHIARRSQEEGLPMLNLHKSFLQRQGSDWVTSGLCYQDFVEKSALGSVLSAMGVCRYRSRIISFHGHFDQNVAVVKPLVDQAPLPLWYTYQYTEDDVASELLTSLGYELKTRVMAVKEKKKAKKLAKRVEAAKALQQEPVNGEGVGKAVAQQRGRKQERGRKRARSWDSEKCSVTRPYNYTLMSIDTETFRGMVSQIGDLKEKLRQAVKKLQETEDKLRQRDNHLVKLEVLKDKLRSDAKISERSEKACEFRCREAERYITRQAERHHEELLEWREAQSEWRSEKKELERKLEQAEDKVRVQGMQMSVWEDWCRKQTAKQGSSKKK